MIFSLLFIGALGGDPGLITQFDNYSAVRIEQTSASDTAEKGPGNETFRICKRMTTVGPGVEFLLAIPSAARASELPVECFEFFDLRVKYVLVAFNELPREFGVHLLERHA